jgi:tripartite-type tricarboxylate transporter receptor subunit TctC
MMGITRRRSFLQGAVSAAALSLGVAPGARADTWPSKPIRIIVSFPAGGLTDTMARAHSEYMSQKLGQPIVVENKAGAAGIIGAETVARSAPDGYTLLYTITTTVVMNRVIYKTLPYDPEKDFVYIAMTSGGHLPFVVRKSVPATNIKEFVAWARSNKASIGSYSIGSYSHMAIAELNRQFGLTMEAVHYRGEAPMWQDLASGAIHAASGSYLAGASVLQSGVGRPIAVPLTTRMKKLPDVATFLEQGVTSPAFQVRAGWGGLLGPAGMPQDVVDRISALMVEAGASPKVRGILDTFGIDDSAIGHKEFTRIVREEGPVLIDLVKRLDIKPQ